MVLKPAKALGGPSHLSVDAWFLRPELYSSVIAALAPRVTPRRRAWAAADAGLVTPSRAHDDDVGLHAHSCT